MKSPALPNRTGIDWKNGVGMLTKSQYSLRHHASASTPNPSPRREKECCRSWAPSYPGAHAVLSAAAAEVLISFFERDHFEFNVTSEVLPGVERSFAGFSAAAEEATLSRVFAGQHFRFDLAAGQRLGREVADFVTDNFLTHGHRKHQSDPDK